MAHSIAGPIKVYRSIGLESVTVIRGDVSALSVDIFGLECHTETGVAILALLVYRSMGLEGWPVLPRQEKPSRPFPRP